MDKSSFLHLKRFRVEELKSRLHALEAMKQGLEENVRQLDDTLQRETLRSGDSAIARLAMPNIRQMIEFRRKNIEKTRADLERDKGALESQLISALQEVQTAEFAELERNRRASRAAEEVAEFRRERQLMQQHLRRHVMR